MNNGWGAGRQSGGFWEEEASGVAQRLSSRLPVLAGAPRPGTPGAPAGRVRSELKTKQQILKQRRHAQKMRFLQRGGLKQLSARGRRHAQELRQGAFGRGAHAKKGKMRKRL